MVSARQQWTRAETAEVLAVLYNTNRDPEIQKEPWEAYEFNPFFTEEDIVEIQKHLQSKQGEPLRMDIKDLKQAICKRFDIKDK